MAKYAILTADQGASFAYTVPTFDANKNPLDLASHTVSAKFRKEYGSSVVYEFEASIDSPTTLGKITLQLSGAFTNTIKVGRYFYDVEITNTSTNETQRVLEGIFELTAAATQSADDYNIEGVAKVPVYLRDLIDVADSPAADAFLYYDSDTGGFKFLQLGIGHLNNVDITGIQQGEVLKWDSSNQKFIPGIDASESGALTLATFSAVDNGGFGSFSYNNITGEFTYNGIDSADILGVADSGYVTAMIDSAYINARVDAVSGVDSAAIQALIDSDYINSRIIDQVGIDSATASSIITNDVTKTFVDALGIDAVTLGGHDSSYYLNYNNLSNTPTIPSPGIDSATATTIANTQIDSALAVLDTHDSAAVSGQISITVDSAYVQARQITNYATSSDIDSAINALIGGAPATLDTLNEIAAALNNDSDAYNTLVGLIGEKTDSATVAGQIAVTINKAFVDALNVDADTLDGQDGTYYSNYNNLSNKPNILDSANVVSIFDSEIGTTSIGALSNVDLTGIQTNYILKWNGSQFIAAVDATGSAGGGGDAETLGGHDSSYYLNYNNFTNTPSILDSANVTSIINTTDTHDSALVLGQIDSAVNKTFVDALGVDAATLGGNDSSYYLNYNNFTNTPTIPEAGLDSISAGALIDSGISAASIGDLSNVDLTGIQLDYILKWDGSGFVVAADATGSSGVGGDASTLNGQSGAYYLDYDNFTNTPNILDSADVTIIANTQIDSALSVLDTHDSAAVIGQINATVDKTFVDALNVDADTLDGQDGTYYLNYNNLSNTPNVLDSNHVGALIDSAIAGLDTHDSAAVSGQITSTIDSAYVKPLARAAIVAGNNITYDSATGVISGVAAYGDSDVQVLVDQAYIDQFDTHDSALVAGQITNQVDATFVQALADSAYIKTVSGILGANITGSLDSSLISQLNASKIVGLQTILDSADVTTIANTQIDSAFGANVSVDDNGIVVSSPATIVVAGNQVLDVGDSAFITGLFSAGNGLTYATGKFTLDSSANATFANVFTDEKFGMYDSASGTEVGHLRALDRNTIEFLMHDGTASNPRFVFTIENTGPDSDLMVISRDSGVSFEGQALHNIGTPVLDNDAATKVYVDGVAQGLHIHEATKAATVQSLTSMVGISSVAYNNGASGVGAYIQITGSLDSIDGIALLASDRILIKNETDTTTNGIYVWDSATRITRAVDFDTSVEIAGGDFVFNQEGTVNENAGFVQTEDVNSVGDSAVVFVQFSGAGQIVAGDGIAKSGNQLSVDLATNSGLEFQTAKLAVNYDNATIGISGGELAVLDGGINTDKLATTGGLAVTLLNIAGNTTENLDDLTGLETSTNKFLSSANIVGFVDSAYVRPLARAAIVAGTNISYDSATGVISSTYTLDDTIGADSSVGSATRIPILTANAKGQITALYDVPLSLSSFSTTDLSEGTNLYYTTVRSDSDFDARLATKSTTDLTEGSNKYYTKARFDSDFGLKSTTDLTEGSNKYYTQVRVDSDFDARLATKSTSDLAEGTNLYYTTARFDSDLGSTFGSMAYQDSDNVNIVGGSIDNVVASGNTQIASYGDSDITLDFSTYQNFVLTLTGNATLVNPTTEKQGQSGFIVIVQDGTGSRTLSYGTEYKTAGGSGLTLSTAASSKDIVPYIVSADSDILLGTPQLAFS